jgi:aldehyde:ferredoxin oxidoreductase
MAQGWTRVLDTLPPRLLEPNGDTGGISPNWLERQIDAYYAVRGWDEAGRPLDLP